MTSCLYEQEQFRAAAGCEFRPGGLDLSAQLAIACRLRQGQRVLDVGCGVGSTASLLAEKWGVTAVGLDSSSLFIAEARARDSAVIWLVGEAQEIPWSSGYFDVVLTECFLSTLVDPGPVLREIQRVLRPGGLLGVTDLYLRGQEAGLPLSQSAGAACLRGARGREATVSLFAEAGFVVRQWRDCSEALTAMTASLVFSYGSRAAFWDAVVGRDGRGFSRIVTEARPGYYLLVGQVQQLGEIQQP